MNCVCPGVVKTKFAGAILEMEEELSKQFSMQRFAEPEEISGIVSFLADNERNSGKIFFNLVVDTRVK